MAPTYTISYYRTTITGAVTGSALTDRTGIKAFPEPVSDRNQGRGSMKQFRSDKYVVSFSGESSEIVPLTWAWDTSDMKSITVMAGQEGEPVGNNASVKMRVGTNVDANGHVDTTKWYRDCTCDLGATDGLIHYFSAEARNNQILANMTVPYVWINGPNNACASNISLPQYVQPVVSLGGSETSKTLSAVVMATYY